MKNIHIRNLIGNRNRWLDLSEDKVKFNVDHLFKLPATTRSLVFFPYQINVDEIDEFNKYCKANDYRVVFIGGESIYGGKAPFTNGTMTILLLHKYDEKNINFPLFTLMDSLQYNPETYTQEMLEKRIKISEERRKIEDQKIKDRPLTSDSLD